MPEDQARFAFTNSCDRTAILENSKLFSMTLMWRSECWILIMSIVVK
jgi:hypothetical protein